MNIYTPCPNCKQEARLSTIYKDRVTLARKKGNDLSVNCQGCGTIFKTHVDEFKARKSALNFMVVATTLVLGFGLFYLFYILALTKGLLLISGLPFAAYFIYQKQLQQKIRGFNKHYLKRNGF